MSARKTPILLRPAPLSGGVVALTRYSWKTFENGRKVIAAATDGKHDVTEDFESIMLMRLMDDGAENIVSILDGAAEGMDLTVEERAEIRVLRERLREACERHNARRAEGSGKDD